MSGRKSGGRWRGRAPGRLAADGEVWARLLWQAAETGWLAGLTSRAISLLDEARGLAANPRTRVEIDRLAGHIAAMRGRPCAATRS